MQSHPDSGKICDISVYPGEHGELEISFYIKTENDLYPMRYFKRTERLCSILRNEEDELPLKGITLPLYDPSYNLYISLSKRDDDIIFDSIILNEDNHIPGIPVTRSAYSSRIQISMTRRAYAKLNDAFLDSQPNTIIPTDTPQPNVGIYDGLPVSINRMKFNRQESILNFYMNFRSYYMFKLKNPIPIRITESDATIEEENIEVPAHNIQFELHNGNFLSLTVLKSPISGRRYSYFVEVAPDQETGLMFISLPMTLNVYYNILAKYLRPQEINLSTLPVFKIAKGQETMILFTEIDDGTVMADFHEERDRFHRLYTKEVYDLFIKPRGKSLLTQRPIRENEVQYYIAKHDTTGETPIMPVRGGGARNTRRSKGRKTLKARKTRGKARRQA